MLKSGCPRAKWDAEKDSFLIKLLIRQKDAGKQSDTGFKKEAWMSILSKFNHHFSCTLDKEKIKTRYNQLKAEWKLFLSLKNDSGFGWDPNESLPHPTRTFASGIGGVRGNSSDDDDDDDVATDAMNENDNESATEMGEDISSEEELPKKRKADELPPLRERRSVGFAIAKSIQDWIQLERESSAPKSLALSVESTRAIELLNKEYSHQTSDDGIWQLRTISCWMRQRHSFFFFYQRVVDVMHG
ncbi:hypothetical protein LEN26_017675 [Aphanomyces euteiches]|nr:hypothetical protein LEN26_017675 [Aphanomyces euteiches]KAH9123453.1 hypothetical protein AeMF1_005560 [Aphanomyces euteiches]KAH9182096.1 hypothetical protein AeNC1_015928 [Aphanomyces euteiches]